MRSTSARHIPYTTFRKTRSVRRCKKTFSCFFAGVSWRESVGRWSNGIRKEAYSLSPSPPAAAANEWQVSSVRALPRNQPFLYEVRFEPAHTLPLSGGHPNWLTSISRKKERNEMRFLFLLTFVLCSYLPVLVPVQLGHGRWRRGNGGTPAAWKKGLSWLNVSFRIIKRKAFNIHRYVHMYRSTLGRKKNTHALCSYIQ